MGQGLHANRVSHGIPIQLHLREGCLYPRFLYGPYRVILVFLPVVYAHTVGRRSSNLRTEPCVPWGATLALPTNIRVLCTPLLRNRFVLTRRSFAQAKRVYRGRVRRQSWFYGVDQVVVNCGRPQVSPFCRVLDRRLQAITRRLVNRRRTTFQGCTANRNEFSSQDHTRVRRHSKPIRVLAWHLFRRRKQDFLRVVTTHVGRKIGHGQQAAKRMVSFTAPKRENTFLQGGTAFVNVRAGASEHVFFRNFDRDDGLHVSRRLAHARSGVEEWVRISDG